MASPGGRPSFTGAMGARVWLAGVAAYLPPSTALTVRVSATDNAGNTRQLKRKSGYEARAAALPRRLFIAVVGLLIGGLIAAYRPGAERPSTPAPRSSPSTTPGTSRPTIRRCEHDTERRYVVSDEAENFFADTIRIRRGRRVGGIFATTGSTGPPAVADGDVISNAIPRRWCVAPRTHPFPTTGDYVVLLDRPAARRRRHERQRRRLRAGHECPVDPRPSRVGGLQASSQPRTEDRRPRRTRDRDSETPPELSGQRNPGSQVWPGTAISGDGRYVAFRTLAWGSSDLPSEANARHHRAGQVFVRDLVTHHTSLLTQTSQTTGATALWIALPVVALGPVVISADGSTVSWLGNNAPAQTVLLNGEAIDTRTRFYLLRRWQAPERDDDPLHGDCRSGQPALPTGWLGRDERVLDRSLRRAAHRRRGRAQRLLPPRAGPECGRDEGGVRGDRRAPAAADLVRQSRL